MEVTIRPFGNSKGIVIPKPLLAQVGLQDVAELVVENGALVLRKPTKAVRAGWADAAKAVAHAQGDALLLGEFGNVDDEDLTW